VGNLLAIPIIGWILGPVVAICVAIPFYVLWQWFDMKQFFTFLPAAYLNIGFWQTVGLFLTFALLRMVLLPSFSCACDSEKRK
jgi:hypothetical protein